MLLWLMILQYVGEEGEACELKAAVVVSSPWNLEVGNVALKSTWLGREVYSKTMGTNMKELAARHQEEVSKNTRIDFPRLMKTKYLYEFDREVQCPTWGYPTLGAYYRDASSVDSLLAARIPLFAINATDDPVSQNNSCPRLYSLTLIHSDCSRCVDTPC